MCDFCRSSPCHPQCPYAPDPPAIICAQCGEVIFPDIEYWTDIDDNIFCSDECAKAYWGIRCRYI